MPAFKLKSKTRVGSQIKKAYDAKVLSPYQRLLVSAGLSDEAKAELTKRYGLYDPAALQREVHDAVNTLISLTRPPKLDGVRALALAALYAT